MFDSDYSKTSSSLPREGEGLVSFFDQEPVKGESNRTEWSSAPVPEEDLREGMDDYRKSEESDLDDVQELIASMPHNVAKRDKNMSSGSTPH